MPALIVHPERNLVAMTSAEVSLGQGNEVGITETGSLWKKKIELRGISLFPGDVPLPGVTKETPLDELEEKAAGAIRGRFGEGNWKILATIGIVTQFGSESSYFMLLVKIE